jgi:hypothetical protein
MISVIIILVVLGIILYLVETYIPMSPPFKLVIRVVIVLFSILYLLRVFGIADTPVPHFR